MQTRWAASVCWLGLAIILSSCAPAAQAPTERPGAPAAGRPAAPKRVTVAMLGILPAFWDDIAGRGGVVPGTGQFKGLASAGLVVLDEQNVVRPQLGEYVPSIENGNWKLFPDGRMELTWKIRDGVRWHDGQPLTSADLLFSLDLARDKDIRVLGGPALDLVESVEATDARTVVVTWQKPYISADAMFGVGSSGSRTSVGPLPKHILESQYRDNKANFGEWAYWTTEFVSSGPFKLREWAADSHVILDAFPDYVLGRPKIDQIEVKFIPDPSTLLANVLAGAVDLTFSRAVSVEQAVSTRDRWSEGKMVPYINGWTMMYPQLRAPTPALMGDPQFRRALIMAIDRQQLADTLTAGLAPVADAIISPDQPEFPYVQSSIARYPYDPARAGQILEGLGISKGNDGIYRDAGGQRVAIEIRTTTNDANQKAMLAVADGLQRVGLGADPVVIPVQRLQDSQYRATFPGLELVNQPHGADGFENLLHSANAPIAERNYRAPSSSRNRGAYMNPDYDALMDRYTVTVPIAERMDVMSQLIRLQTDLQLVMGLYYSVDAIMMANKLQEVRPAATWNAHAWDVKS
jgi:peptide/nickel transport system substrate-binding protein